LSTIPIGQRLKDVRDKFTLDKVMDKANTGLDYAIAYTGLENLVKKYLFIKLVTLSNKFIDKKKNE